MKKDFYSANLFRYLCLFYRLKYPIKTTKYMTDYDVLVRLEDKINKSTYKYMSSWSYYHLCNNYSDNYVNVGRRE